MTDDGDRPAGELSRRALLATAGAGAVTGMVGLGAVAQNAASDTQGQVGTSSDPLATAYLSEIRGPIADLDAPIDQLVAMKAAEDGATVATEPNLLVFRYDPNTTV